MQTSALTESFVSHFGEMGSRWGINRSVSQVYALLFVNEEALHADDISETLAMSRSNVSMSLKELQGWQLVHIKRIQGDRREYFTTLGSVWDIFLAVAAERRRREIEPTLSVLRQSLLMTVETDADKYAQERMSEMYELTEMACNWFDELQKLSPQSLKRLMTLGSRVQKLMEFKDRFMSGSTNEDKEDQFLMKELEQLESTPSDKNS